MRKIAILMCVSLVGAAPPPAKDPRAGEGVLCMMVFVDAAAEVGRVCHAGENPVFQAELDGAVGRFDTYVLKNSAITPEQLTQFKREQAHIGAPKEVLCKGDMASIYSTFLSQGVEKLHSGIDQLLARPGKPTWGDCV